jgi:hypothetical protein
MSDLDRGTDRARNRAERLLGPSQKYEIVPHRVRQEATMPEPADRWEARWLQ